MAKIKLKKWDSAEHLKTDKDMVQYLEPVWKKQAMTQPSSPKPSATSPVPRE